MTGSAASWFFEKTNGVNLLQQIEATRTTTPSLIVDTLIILFWKRHVGDLRVAP